MTPYLRLGLLIVFLAAPATAQDLLSPGAFEALAQGHTLYFTRDGVPFGAEQYFADRRTLWRFADGTCGEGRWWDAGGQVCFRYEDEDPAQCWRFRSQPGGLMAELVEGGADSGLMLDLDHVDQAPLPCPGPRVGS